MAKTPVKLEVDGYKEREVMMVKYEFDQATDVEGQMSGIPRGGKINIRVKALNDGTPDLLAWMVERNLPKNGVITFLETKTGKNMKTIKFTNGYSVNIEEKWEDNPVYGNYYDNRNVPHKRVQYAEGVFVGFRGFDRNGKQPLYPFGY